MYNAYYGLRTKPFQLNPDPGFFFGSKGHNRAMAYLDYGVSQGAGFIVITGEIGAGKTTLVRNLCRKLNGDLILVAHIVNSALDAGDLLQMVTAAFHLPFEGVSKATLLLRLHQFIKECDQSGKRILLIVDEAQNLSKPALEELRMLSNLQSGDKSLLQTFLLGQPEFRSTLMSDDMTQLRQRVTATYHLGPLDAAESKAYILHRLKTVGWHNDPSISDAAFAAIYEGTQGIPRKINTLCDRLFLMGFLDALHRFDQQHIEMVIADMAQEFSAPVQEVSDALATVGTILAQHTALPALAPIDEHVIRLESSFQSLLETLRKMVFSSRLKSASEKSQ